MKKPILGKGLSALMKENFNTDNVKKSIINQESSQEQNIISTLSQGEVIRKINISKLHAGKYQPRTYFDNDKIIELSHSIAEKGILQPLLVRPHPDIKNEFEIIAGERRWRAAGLAQVHEIPVIVKNFNDKETLQVSLIENLQRQDLNIIEEADGFKRLIEEFSYTQEDLAQILSKSRSHLTNTLRLLTLPDSIKKLIASNVLSARHGRALVGVKNALELAQKAIKLELSASELEKLIKLEGERKTTTKQQEINRIKDANIKSLEDEIANKIGMSVEIKDKKGKGFIKISYKTALELENLLIKIR